MHSSVQVVTPEMAANHLSNNAGNRRLSKSHLAFFEEQLKRGEWRLTHQGIAIGESGRLLDGQHRLAAIASTGIAATLMVFEGVPDELFSVLDTGRARTSSDVLSISGVRSSSVVSAAIKLYLLYKECPHFAWTGQMPRRVASHSRILEVYKAEQEQWDEIGLLAQSHATNKVLIPGTFACAAYLFIQKGHSIDSLEMIASKLRHGQGLQLGDPALAYRNKCMAGTGSRQQERLAEYIKLCNYTFMGQELRMFKKLSCPPMPVVVGPICSAY